MNELEVGQVLWWVDWRNMTEGTVKVIEINGNDFTVQFNIGSRSGTAVRNKSIIGEKLFFESQLPKLNQPYPDESIIQAECENCMLNKRGDCNGISGKVCDDYRAAPHIPESEKKYWPSSVNWNYTREEVESWEKHKPHTY